VKEHDKRSILLPHSGSTHSKRAFEMAFCGVELCMRKEVYLRNYGGLEMKTDVQVIDGSAAGIVAA